MHTWGSLLAHQQGNTVILKQVKSVGRNGLGFRGGSMEHRTARVLGSGCARTRGRLDFSTVFLF